MSTVHDFLKCPKCGKAMMKKSVHPVLGREYFSHCCHQYFGVNELVNQWNYDAADLTPTYPVTHANYKGWITVPPTTETSFYSEVLSLEPDWDTLHERVDAYAMVNRMLLGIPELDDYLDLKETQEYALQTGVQ